MSFNTNDSANFTRAFGLCVRRTFIFVFAFLALSLLSTLPHHPSFRHAMAEGVTPTDQMQTGFPQSAQLDIPDLPAPEVASEPQSPNVEFGGQPEFFSPTTGTPGHKIVMSPGSVSLPKGSMPAVASAIEPFTFPKGPGQHDRYPNSAVRPAPGLASLPMVAIAWTGASSFEVLLPDPDGKAASVPLPEPSDAPLTEPISSSVIPKPSQLDVEGFAPSTFGPPDSSDAALESKSTVDQPDAPENIPGTPSVITPRGTFVNVPAEPAFEGPSYAIIREVKDPIIYSRGPKEVRML